MSNFKVNLAEAQRLYGEMFVAVNKLHDELELFDADYTSVDQLIAFHGSIVQTLINTSIRLQQVNSVNYHVGERHYVICRLTADLERPLTWDELTAQNIEGPWKAYEGSLRLAFSTRDRRNTDANRPNSTAGYDKGRVPGKYTYQVWTYDPKGEGFGWTLRLDNPKEGK